jgi:uncharacterized phage-associated protein
MYVLTGRMQCTSIVYVLSTPLAFQLASVLRIGLRIPPFFDERRVAGVRRCQSACGPVLTCSSLAFGRPTAGTFDRKQIRGRVKYDRLKALNSLLYLCDHLPKPVDVYTALKVVYFADKLHLERYGRLMFGETYIAMENGPVPSGAYDIVKYVSGRAKYDLNFPEANECLYATTTELIQKRDANIEVLSRSELTCLVESARAYGALSFDELKRLSHDDPWKRADANGELDLIDIANSLPDGELVSAHLMDRTPGTASIPPAKEEDEGAIRASSAASR